MNKNGNFGVLCTLVDGRGWGEGGAGGAGHALLFAILKYVLLKNQLKAF